MKNKENLKTNKLFVLIKHFFIRFLNNDLIKYSSERSEHLIFAVVFFAFSGGIISYYLLKKHLDAAKVLDNVYPWQVETSFLTIMMALMGIICVVIWDNIFLDKKDFSNLLVLPVKMGKLFLAKFLSMLMFVGALSILFVLASTIVFSIYLSPTLSTDPFYFGFIFFFTGLLANLFIFLLVATIKGIIIVFFGRIYLRKVLIYAQLLLLGGFLSVFIWFPRIFPKLPQYKERLSSFIDYFPPLWFTGLQNVLLFTKREFFIKMMHKSIAALALLLAVYFLCMLIGLKKHLLSSQLNKSRAKTLKTWGFLKNTFYKLVLKNPTQAAVFYFTIKTLRKNMKHKLQLALAMIIPIGIISATMVYGYIEKKFAYFKEINPALISIPVLLYIFLIPGLKMVTRNPVQFKANWIFRMTEKKNKADYLAGFKKALFLHAIFPLFCFMLLFYSFCWGFKPAIYHSCFGITLGWILLEVFFLNYRNMPFASECLPYQANLKYSWIIYVLLFSLYATNFTALGLFLVKNPVYYIVFYLAAFIVLIALKLYRKKTLKEFDFVFDEETQPMLLSLELDK